MMRPLVVGILLYLLLGIASSAGSWHHLHKRQLDRCDVLSLNDLCTNGYYEDLSYIAAQCNFSDFANALRQPCQRNSEGILCGVLDFGSLRLPRECFASTTTCPAKCRNFLASNRATHGCCISVYNSSSAQESEKFSYSLWSRCGVETVTETCALSFKLPAVDPTCSNVTLFNQRAYFNVYCRKKLINYLRRFAEEEPDCLDTLDTINYIEDLCAADAEGRYCDLGPASDLFPEERIASTNCRDTSTCDPLCMETLTNLTNTYGCCFITMLNSTTVTQRDWLSYEFWQRCGLTSPGFCDPKFTNAAISTDATIFIVPTYLLLILVTLYTMCI